MQNSKIGRNDPCPCGSGKKYKKCCLANGESSAPGGAGQGIHAKLQQAMEEKEFSSLEEAQEFAQQFMQQSNQRPVDDFHGLTPEQMYQAINVPFDSPQLAHFPESLETAGQAPIMYLFNLLVEAIGEDGLKATAKGNLPQKFCREAAPRFWSEVGYQDRILHGKVNKEEDFFDLNVTRLIAQTAGLIRKYKGRFILSRQCRKLLAEGGGAIYPRLFKAFVEEYNWGYGDRYPDVHFIQHAFLFSLHLLQRYGVETKPAQFYADCFLNAFPMLFEEVEDEPYTTKEEMLSNVYTLRTLLRFTGFLGLTEVEHWIDREGAYPRRAYKITKLPLLDDVVRFNV